MLFCFHYIYSSTSIYLLCYFTAVSVCSNLHIKCVLNFDKYSSLCFFYTLRQRYRNSEPLLDPNITYLSSSRY